MWGGLNHTSRKVGAIAPQPPFATSMSTSIAIFRLILLCSITPQHSLRSRVKDSITHNSTVILSSNFNGRLVYKCEFCLYISMKKYCFVYELSRVFQNLA